MGGPLTIGVVGAGKISTAYLDTISHLPTLSAVAVADVVPQRAETVATAHDGLRALTPDQLFAAPDIEVILNLTVPAAHASVTLDALRGGKHVYSEKPLAVTREEARRLVERAQQADRVLGCAPDIPLGTGVQTARALLDRGAVGEPVAATAFFVRPGHEHWHPNPEYYYQPGGGPLFDMGPYYLTALVTLLGPVTSVTAMTTRAREQRTIGSGPKRGMPIQVEVETHVTGALKHASGAITTMIMSFDVQASQVPCIEVFGLEGTLSVNPNEFASAVLMSTDHGETWPVAQPAGGYVDASRGYGLVELAQHLGFGTPNRTSAELAYHVVDIVESLLESARRHSAIAVESTVERPQPVELTTITQ